MQTNVTETGFVVQNVDDFPAESSCPALCFNRSYQIRPRIAILARQPINWKECQRSSMRPEGARGQWVRLGSGVVEAVGRYN